MYNNNTSHETEMSCFGGGPNFCPECGNVLPLPGIPDVVCCPGCSFRIPVSGKFHIRVYVWAWAAEILLLSHFLFFSFRFHLDIPVIFIQPVQMKRQSSYLRAICELSAVHLWIILVSCSKWLYFYKLNIQYCGKRIHSLIQITEFGVSVTSMVTGE